MVNRWDYCGKSCGTLEQKPKPPADETLLQKKQRQAKARIAARKRSFEAKESYRWVEAIKTVGKQVGAATRVLHVFDREGDIQVQWLRLVETARSL